MIFRGEFVRRARVSFLAFIGQNGVLDYYQTDGTFTRLKFMHCLKLFAKNCSQVQKYPGYCSIWILDGAKIHTDENLVYYLRSFGIILIYLPAYCPFFNPIEFFFGMVKQRFRKLYKEGENQDLSIFVSEIMSSYINYNFTNIFNKCGYRFAKAFDPSAADIALNQEWETHEFNKGNVHHD